MTPPPAYKTGGDDLDDGLELDPDLLASDDEDVGDIFSADEEDAVPAPATTRKRKASGDVDAHLADEQGDVAMLPVEGDAKKRRREKDKARRAAKVGRTRSGGVELMR